MDDFYDEDLLADEAGDINEADYIRIRRDNEAVIQSFGKSLKKKEAARENVTNIREEEKKKVKITENPDKEIVKVIREGLRESGGYCPCRRERTPDTKCMCKEFRDQIADPEYEGYCHCMLFYKSK